MKMVIKTRDIYLFNERYPQNTMLDILVFNLIKNKYVPPTRQIIDWLTNQWHYDAQTWKCHPQIKIIGCIAANIAVWEA